jgi:hypothetical protein
MSDQNVSPLSTRQASVVLLVLSGLLCSLTALAQTPSGPPSAPTSSQAATQPPSKEALDAWHATMSKTPMPKTAPNGRRFLARPHRRDAIHPDRAGPQARCSRMLRGPIHMTPPFSPAT